MRVIQTVAHPASLLLLVISFVAIGLTGCAAAYEGGNAHTDTFGPRDRSTHIHSLWNPGARKGVHGMIVFGSSDDQVFMSHIPMFHAPHDVQLVMEVRFPSRVPSFGGGLYTFLPERFSLDDVILGSCASFEGTLYEGNFEAGGQPLENATVTVTKIIHASVLDSHAPVARSPRYLLLGSKKQRYLVHEIRAAPGFDQILSGTLFETYQSIPAETWVVATGRDDRVEQRLQAKTVASLDRDDGGPGVVMFLDKELSVLVGPDFVGPPMP